LALKAGNEIVGDIDLDNRPVTGIHPAIKAAEPL